MARYIIDNRIDEAEGLKDFNYEGYGYDAARSSASQWVFTRRQ